MEAQKKLYENASDLWYTLREDYPSFEKFSDDFKQYLALQTELLKSMPDTQRLDTLEPIAHNANNARNVAYSIITTISDCRKNFPNAYFNDLNNLLADVAEAFSIPNYPQHWDDLYASVQQFSERI